MACITDAIETSGYADFETQIDAITGSAIIRRKNDEEKNKKDRERHEESRKKYEEMQLTN